MRHYAKLLRATLTALLMPVLIAGAAVAGPLQDAGAALQRGDYKAVPSQTPRSALSLKLVLLREPTD
jgi:hypothetical protein